MPDLPKLKSFPIWAKTFESGVFVITSKPNIKKIRKIGMASTSVTSATNPVDAA